MSEGHRCDSCFISLVEKSDTCPTCGWKEEKKRRNPFALPNGRVLHAQYYIGKVLGQGGFGITYLAWDLNQNRKVALKEYFPVDIARRNDNFHVMVSSTEHQELYEYGKQRFLDEANALVRFNRHPGIVAVYDLFTEHQTVYMAMQYLDGKTLRQVIEASGGRLPYDEALSIFIPALDAIRAVHEVGMLHRDISPDNIMVLPNKQIKVIDFGAARYAMKQHQVYSIIFKPGYTPEEQYRGKGDIGPWSDIYSLSATFYFLITGKAPRDALNRLENDTLLPPTKMEVYLPKRMEDIFLQAMAVKSKDRFRSVEEFKKALIESINTLEEVKINMKTPLWVWLITVASVVDFIFIFFLFIF